jgi:phosphoribosylformylglycinamidine (FGAM) synthase-like amidotransferase family enzyme
MSTPRSGVNVCVITGYGINADEELALAFVMAGAAARRIHAGDLERDPGILSRFHIAALPGGFSFGDHLGSGKVFAALFRRSLGPALERLVARGGLIIGVCNGFQALVKMGFLPDLTGARAQEVSLIHNDSGRFEDRWVRVAFEPSSRCVWTRGLPETDLPVRHGEGKFVVKSPGVRDELDARGLVALRYVCRDPDARGEVRYPDDPNGSVGHIAGICDSTGRVFGLMPHPEAFLFPENHPDWTRRRLREGGGLAIFRNGVRAFARAPARTPTH